MAVILKKSSIFDSDAKRPSLIEELQVSEIKEEKSIPNNELEDIFYTEKYENLPEYFEYLSKLDRQLEKGYKNQSEGFTEDSLEQPNSGLAKNIIIIKIKNS